MPSVAAWRAWAGVMILWLFYVLSLMDRGVTSLMVAPIMRDMGISPVQMGLLQGFAFAALYTLAALPLGWAVDHTARRKLLCAGILVWSAATIACGLAVNYTQIFVARAFVGCGEAVLIPTALSLIADMFPRHRVATATAVLSSGATVGAGAALMLGGVVLRSIEVGGDAGMLRSLLGDMAPWRAVFVIFGTFGLLAAWLSFLVPDTRQSGKSLGAAAAKPASMAEFWSFVNKQRGLLAYVFLSFPLLIAGMIGFLSWAPRHVETAFGWDIRTVGLVIGSLKLVATPLGVICGGLVMDKALRAGVRAPYFVIPVATTLLGGPLLAAGLLHTDPTYAVVLLALGMFLFSAYGSSHYVVLQVLAPPSLRGRLTALYLMTITLVGTGLGALLPPVVSLLSGGSKENFGRATAITILAITFLAATLLTLGRGRLEAALAESRRE